MKIACWGDVYKAQDTHVVEVRGYDVIKSKNKIKISTFISSSL